jgi:hypothetical protein
MPPFGAAERLTVPDSLQPLGLLQSRLTGYFSDRSERSETREQCATVQRCINSAAPEATAGSVTSRRVIEGAAAPWGSIDGARRKDVRAPRRQERQASEPNSTSTGVGVLTSVLNFSLPLDG